MTIMEFGIREILKKPTHEVVKACGGFYSCPKDADGRRLGPLVGYAGTYTDEGGRPRQYVGDTYYNFAKAEPYPQIMRFWARKLRDMIRRRRIKVSVFLGAPMGGIKLATHLSDVTNKRGVFAEKKVTALATTMEREHSELLINRHEIMHGDEVVIVEDVCNNFSTTRELIALVERANAKVVAIACLLNRSEQKQFEGLPVLSVEHMVIPEYRQDNPFVAADIKAGNVAWKPKNKDEWKRLAAAQKAYVSA